MTLPCGALLCLALPYPALPCHGCALTDQVQERSGICIAFVHVLGHPWCNRGCFAGHAAVIPLLHAMMCLHSFIHPSDRLSIHASFAGSCIRSFSRLPVRPSMHPSIHAYIHPFIHSFIRSSPRVRYRQSIMRLLCTLLVQSRSHVP